MKKQTVQKNSNSLEKSTFVMTKAPLNYYLIIIVTTVSFALGLIYQNSILQVSFYTILTFGLLYFHFCRFGCRIKLDERQLEIKYLYPWYKRECIHLNDIDEFDYEKGYYDLFAEKTIGAGYFLFPIYCYDRLIFKTNVGTKVKVVKVNTRAFELDKVIKILKTKAKLI